MPAHGAEGGHVIEGTKSSTVNADALSRVSQRGGMARLRRRPIHNRPATESEDPKADQIDQRNDSDQRPPAATAGPVQDTGYGYAQEDDCQERHGNWHEPPILGRHRAAGPELQAYLGHGFHGVRVASYDPRMMDNQGIA